MNAKINTKKPKSLKSRSLRARKSKPAQIVIDQQAGLIFSSEKELFAFFEPQTTKLEQDYDANKKSNDFTAEDIEDIGEELDLTLDEPAEIWHDSKTFQEFPIFYFIRPLEHPIKDEEAFHVAVCYVSSDDEPTFIFMHFLTKDLDLIEKYRKGDLIYDRAFEEVGFAALEGDAISEGDPLSIGLFLAMLKVRSEKDVAFEKFQELGVELREDTIENADEIWRTSDLHGNNLVTFIKEYPDHDIKDLFYVAVTQEDSNSQVHALLFSFPTTDENLLDRYRHGENLQAEEVIQESSH